MLKMAVHPTWQVWGCCALVCIILLVALSSHFQGQILRAFLNSAIIGGALSGSLHALTGSDHLAALLPLIFGKRWWQGALFGSIWGLGHGVTSGVIGMLSYTMKSYFMHTSDILEVYGYVVDGVVGLTLLVIGAMGIYESSSPTAGEGEKGEKITDEEAHPSDIENISIEQITINGVAVEQPSTVPSWQRSAFTYGSVLINGSVLGASWDGLPSLAPAVVLEDLALYLFLLGYIVGTIITMAFAAGLVSESSRWLSRVVKVDVSERLAAVSSLCAIAIGALWALSALLKFLHMRGHDHADGYGIGLHDMHDGTAMGASHHTPSVATAHSADISSNDHILLASLESENDTFHEHALGLGWSVCLGAGSLMAVLAVVVYATRSSLGFGLWERKPLFLVV